MNSPEMVNLCQQHGEKLDKLDEKLDKIDALLRGTDDKPGLNTRVYSVEKFVAVAKKCVWVVTGTTLTALTMIGVYWAMFRHLP